MNDAAVYANDLSAQMDAALTTGMWVVFGILGLSVAAMLAKPVLDTAIEVALKKL